MGKAISLRVSNLPAKARKVVKRMETPCLSDRIMRRPRADREEKRVTHENEKIKKRVTIRTGRLDASDPNQRRLLAVAFRPTCDNVCFLFGDSPPPVPARYRHSGERAIAHPSLSGPAAPSRAAKRW